MKNSTRPKAILAFILALAFLSSSSFAQPDPNGNVEDMNVELIDAKILIAGVPSGSLKRIREFIAKNKGSKIRQAVYSCRNQAPGDARVCEEADRAYSTKEITILNPRRVISIDFGMPSTKKRMFLIDLATGEVESYFVTHGRGSGISKWSFKFSNIKDSKQSSLGLYQTGEVYFGHYGEMMRLYGLERSNDQAYNRDIVVHKADYAKPDFIDRVDPATGKPFDRLGLSWGCPAVSPDVMAKLMPILKQGVIYDLYHSELMQAAQSGHEVKVEEPKE